MRRDLPVVVPPVAYGYQFYAFPLAIVGTEPRARDWVLSNFIQLAYDTRPGSPVPLCFYLDDYADNPWLEVVRTTPEWLDGLVGDIVAFTREQIARGWYVYLLLDDFHVPHRRAYGRRHRLHDILVVGVDDDAGEFAVLGYDERLVFGAHRISQPGFRTAYRSFADAESRSRPLLCYRLRADADYPLDVRLVLRTLVEYLEGANTSEHYAMAHPPWSRAYGLDVYPPLRDYLEGYLAGDEPYDIKHLHVLWEHKRLMTERARRLPGLDAELVERLRRLADRAFLLRLLMMRHERGPADGSLAQAVAGLDAIERADREATARMVDALAPAVVP